MDQAFTNAIRAQKARFVCLGVRLQPLTVGHLFVLLEHGNAYPDRAGLADASDLITAVLICSQRSARRARRMVEGRLAPLGVWIWGKLCGKAISKEGLQTAAVEFGKYLEEQLRTPEPEEWGGPKGELKAPLCWRLLSMLMADFGLSRKEALKTNVQWALVMWATEADRRGSCKLASGRQIQFRAWAAEMEKIRRAQQTPAEEGNAS